ncbi:MAG: hypothetical protein JRH20_13385 [Deltaproteobacteria bacterium]|nr:hypothetical protein [Deltaproteobacteria bacterium]
MVVLVVVLPSCARFGFSPAGGPEADGAVIDAVLRDGPMDAIAQRDAMQGCVPTTCLILGFDCGDTDDGCGYLLNCGSCSEPQLCGVDGRPNHCAVPDVYSTGNSEIVAWPGWAHFGSASGGGITRAGSLGVAGSPHLAFDLLGRPLVGSWKSTAGKYNFSIRRLEGDVWTDVGPQPGPGPESGTARRTSFTLDHGGAPLVAWSNIEGDGGYRLGVWRLHAGAWVDGDSSAITQQPEPKNGVSVALDLSNQPILAYSELGTPTGDMEIYLKRFDGSAWVEMGTNSASGGGVSNLAGICTDPRIVLTASGEPILAYAGGPSSGFSEIYAKHFTNGEWTELGLGAGSGGGVSQTPSTSSYSISMTLDEQQRPIIAWLDGSPENWEIFIKRFNGSAWESIGAGSAQGGGISQTEDWSLSPCVVVDGLGQPTVAWEERPVNGQEIMVAQFAASTWRRLPPLMQVGRALSPAMATGPTGMPLVVWSQRGAGINEIYGKRLEAGAWREIGTANASGRGVSASASDSSLPVLAIDAALRPVLAWQETSDTGFHIYFKRYDGSQWVPLGQSAEGEGLSGSGRALAQPQLALDSFDRPLVAWIAMSADGSKTEVHVARFDGSHWSPIVGESTVAFQSTESNLHCDDLQMLLDDNQHPVLAWNCGRMLMTPPFWSSHLLMTRFHGTAWAEVGAGSASLPGLSPDVDSYQVKLAKANSGVFYLAWTAPQGTTGQKTVVQRFDGTNWQDIGSPPVTTMERTGSQISLAVTDNGSPVLVIMENATATPLVLTFDGSTWIETASGATLAPVGVRGASAGLSMVLDSQGLPILGWNEREEGSTNLYRYRLVANVWTPLLSGKGGISRSDAFSGDGTMIARDDVLCTAWSEAGAEARQVLVRCGRRP